MSGAIVSVVVVLLVVVLAPVLAAAVIAVVAVVVAANGPNGIEILLFRPCTGPGMRLLAGAIGAPFNIVLHTTAGLDNLSVL